MEDTIAILMAAGLGTRMSPLTKTTPKPLVKVFGKPIAETVIDGLMKRGVSHIYAVVGYKKEQFCYLCKKYPNLSLIENTEYLVKNNISSIYAASSVMGNANCFICESDLYISDDTVFLPELKESCYYGKPVKGFSDDWAFETDKNGRITHIGKGGTDLYNMVGISYFTKNDAKVIADAIVEAYKHDGHEQLYWDEIVDRQLDRLKLSIYPVAPGQIIEIDTVDELMKLDPDYKNYNS